jgi:hypothetical protein
MRKSSVIDKGVYVKESTIPGAGRGLFASRRFTVTGKFRGDWITHFHGAGGNDVLSKDESNKLIGTPPADYLVSLRNGGMSLLCMRTVTSGIGGGQFANDMPNANASIVRIYDKNTMRTHVFLQARRTISVDEEIFCSYTFGHSS